jgi:hypothetical protein
MEQHDWVLVQNGISQSKGSKDKKDVESLRHFYTILN